MNPKQNKGTFVPIHLYIEDFNYYIPPSPTQKELEEEDEEVERGVYIIELM